MRKGRNWWTKISKKGRRSDEGRCRSDEGRGNAGRKARQAGDKSKDGRKMNEE